MSRWSVFTLGLFFLLISPCRNSGRNEGKQVRLAFVIHLSTDTSLWRVLMARAQRLTEQVKIMSARIKQLEAAAENGSLPLAALGEGPDSKDSLQDSEPNAVEYEGELDSVSKSMGSLAINSEGKAQYYGATAGPEVRFLSPDLSPRYSCHYSFCNISCQRFVSLLNIARRTSSRLFW
jgi:hypothetical protein